MSKRPYQKRDTAYWDQVSQPKSLLSQETTAAQTFTPEFCGDSLFASQTTYASTRSTGTESRSSGRINRAAIKPVNDRYSHIRQLKLPYDYKESGIDIRDAIELTQKAYANISSFKNSIDLMSEFSNTDLYLKGGNKASRDFFSAWLKRINIWSLKEHYFLEYFRSSNIFMYRVDAEWTVEDLMKLKTVYAEEGKLESQKIPIRYIVLNPYNVTSRNTSSFFETMYEQILSPTELARLKNPQTDEDKRVFNGLPDEAKELINKRSWTRDGIKIKLDPQKLHISFAKKQPYEPFAIPFGYSVLGDLNMKLEMKALDIAIMRTVEMAILHFKHGEKKDQHGGGISQATGDALKAILSNGTVGRTLVTDYTVSGEFLIPDLKKVLGPEKYEIINQDIREGLQNIVVGEEKYGNTQAKINVFLEKLRGARNTFLVFLQSEIKRIAKEMGFRVYPEAHFEDLELQDNTEMMRIANRLAELGILTPSQLMEVFQRGEFPSAEEIGLSQEQYVKERKEGKWNPLSPVATQPQPAPLIDPNNELKIKAQSKTGPAAKAKTPKSNGRPASASIDSLRDVALEAQNLEHYIVEKLGGELNDDQKSLAHELMIQIVASQERANWNKVADECLADHSQMLKLQPLSEVLDLCAQSGLEVFAASLFYQAGGMEE